MVTQRPIVLGIFALMAVVAATSCGVTPPTGKEAVSLPHESASSSANNAAGSGSTAPHPGPTPMSCIRPDDAAGVDKQYGRAQIVAMATVEGDPTLIASTENQAWYRLRLTDVDVLAADQKTSVATVEIGTGAKADPPAFAGRYLFFLLRPDPAPDGTVGADLVPYMGSMGSLPVEGDSATVVCWDAPSGTRSSKDSPGSVRLEDMRSWVRAVFGPS